MRMATTILTFFDPERFSVMDVNVWRSLVHFRVVGAFECWFDEVLDYPVYLEACRAVSDWLGQTLRNTDRALWQFAEDRSAP